MGVWPSDPRKKSILSGNFSEEGPFFTCSLSVRSELFLHRLKPLAWYVPGYDRCIFHPYSPSPVKFFLPPAPLPTSNIIYSTRTPYRNYWNLSLSKFFLNQNFPRKILAWLLPRVSGNCGNWTKYALFNYAVWRKVLPCGETYKMDTVR